MLDPRKRFSGKKKRPERSKRRKHSIEKLESRQLLAVVAGQIFTDLDGDHLRGPEELGIADIRVYVDANNNSQFDVSEISVLTDTDGQYKIENLTAGDVAIRVEQGNQKQLSPGAYFGVTKTNVTLGRTQLIEMNERGDIFTVGQPHAPAITGLERTSDGKLFGLDASSTSGVYQIDPVTGATTRLGLVPERNSDSLAYDPETDTLYTIASPGSSGSDYALYTVDKTTGQYSRVSNKQFTIFGTISDLTFDSVNRRVVGIEKGFNRFFSFDLDGTGQQLPAAQTHVGTTNSLGFNGTDFIVFDGFGAISNQAYFVDPYTGAVGEGVVYGPAIMPESITYSIGGDIAQRLRLTDADDVNGIDFAFDVPPPPPKTGNLTGQVWFDANGDGFRDVIEDTLGGIDIFIDANDNGLFDTGELTSITDEAGRYTFTDLEVGEYTVRQIVPRGFYQSSPNAYYGTAYPANSVETQLFEMSLDGKVRRLGEPSSRPLYGLIATNDGTFYGSSFVTDSIYTVNPRTGEERVVVAFENEIAPGLAYDHFTDSIYVIAESLEVPGSQQLHTFDRQTRELLPIGTPLAGINTVSDFVFDPVRKRIVGFDNGADRFFSFDTQGTGQLLASASRSLNSFSLAYDGTKFIMIDQDSTGQRGAVEVNPDTGDVKPSFNASEVLPTESLFYANRGEIAHRITVEEDVSIVKDFALTNAVLGFTITETANETVLSSRVRADEIFVSLDTRPATDVVINVITNPLRLTTLTTPITFTPENWQTPQSVLIEISDSAPLGTTPVTFSIDKASSDPAWGDLEDRVVIAEVEPETTGDDVYINEIFLETTFGNASPYYEFRGPEGGRFGAGTYFVQVSEDTFDEGLVIAVLDLSNQPLGANGFLAVVPNGANYAIDPDSAVLESTTSSFLGLPGGIYERSSRFTFTNDDSAYMLIRSDVKPEINDNIDADKNGTIDVVGTGSGWRILDSISMHYFTGGNFAYSDIVFVESNLSLNRLRAKPGAEVIVTGGYGYAGRVGDSTGSSSKDWVSGQAELIDGVPYLGDDFFGNISHPEYLRLPLDHVGDSNFVGGARGVIFESPPLGDGPSRDPVPAPGLTVFADTNGNGTLDVITHVIEPDELITRDPVDGRVIEDDLTHAAPGVGISRYYDSGDWFYSDIRSGNQVNYGVTLQNRVFYNSSFDWFPNYDRLRFDFYRPVSAASIDVIAYDSAFSVTYGRLEAYNSKDELIGFVRSRRLVNSARETISLTFENEEIAYVMAYSENFQGGTSFGRFDRFVYQQLEPHDVTNDDGTYELTGLTLGDYSITVIPQGNGKPLVGAEPKPITVTRFENFEFVDDVRGNAAPTVAREFQFQIDENADPGFVFGAIAATDIDEHDLTYSILVNDDPNEVDLGIVIDPITGELSYAEDSKPDFEVDSEVRFSVVVTDSLNASAISRVILTINDVNESPVVNDSNILIAETSLPGDLVGQVDAVDPDTATTQTLTFIITGGTAAEILNVDSATGEIRIKQDAVIDFETAQEMTLDLEVSDNANPPATTILTKKVFIEDENDAPELGTLSLAIPENSSGQIAELRVNDPDVGQTHRFEIVGGTGSNLFRVSRSGELFVLEETPLSFELSSSYTLDILVVDNGTPPLSSTSTLAISLTDVNEAASLNVESVSVPETAEPGALVASLSVIDPEGSPQDYVVSLQESVDSANFVFNSLSGELRIATGAKLDFETKRNLELKFEVKDTTGSSVTLVETVRVEVTNRNEKPVILTDRFNVSEAASPGDEVALIRVSDEDRDDRVTLSIVGGTAANLFTINPQTGFIRVAADAVLDFETAPNLSLEIRAVDVSGASFTKTVNIQVNDVNESPQFAAALNLPVMVSGQPLDFTLPASFIVDPENNNFSVSVFDANGFLPEWLSFDPETKEFSGTPNPNQVGDYPLKIRAFESGLADLYTEFSFTIKVELGDSPFNKKRDPLDVDANGGVSPNDALRVINFLNRFGSGAIGTIPESFSGFVDVNGDNLVTALDALEVINGLTLNVIVAQPEFVNRATEKAIDDIEKRNKANDEALLGYLDGSGLF